jgi:hypothetical protein
MFVNTRDQACKSSPNGAYSFCVRNNGRMVSALHAPVYVSMAVFLWQCSYGSVSMAVFLWQCFYGSVPMAVCCRSIILYSTVIL